MFLDIVGVITTSKLSIWSTSPPMLSRVKEDDGTDGGEVVGTDGGKDSGW